MSESRFTFASSNQTEPQKSKKMAMLLQYRKGIMVPVNVEQDLLEMHYNDRNLQPAGASVYYRMMELVRRKSFYIGLTGLFLIADAMLVMMVVKMMA
jgi:hypothetical protein